MASASQQGKCRLFHLKSERIQQVYPAVLDVSQCNSMDDSLGDDTMDTQPAAMFDDVMT